MQKYSSRKTAVNGRAGVIPALFKAQEKKCLFVTGDKVLDIGSGPKTEYIKKYMEIWGVEYHPYDPYNLPEEVNEESKKSGPFTVVTLSNVLNVIMEKEIRMELLKEAYNHLGEYGYIYITVYEGDKSGVVKIDEKKNSCQLNQKLAWYLEEVEDLFYNLKPENKVEISKWCNRWYNIIIIHKIKKEEGK